MRAVSWNWELHMGSTPDLWIYPSTVGEFSEGEEGRLSVADGDRKYKIRDQIYEVDEIPISILLRKDRREYNLLKTWAKATGDDAVRDVWLVAKGAGRDAQSPSGVGAVGAGREETMRFILYNCECAMGKKNAFDRQAKTFDTMMFYLISTDIEEDEGSIGQIY
jgi:hypothetical protein